MNKLKTDSLQLSTTNYNNFATTFSNSRKNMKWEEIDYFLSFLKNGKLTAENGKLSILDIGCGNGRLLENLENIKLTTDNGQLATLNYLGTDLSSGLIDEAKKLHPNQNFQVLDMLDLEKLEADCSTPLTRGIQKYAEEKVLWSIKGARGFSSLNGQLKTDNSQLFDSIFFIASFHHLHTIEQRLEVLKQAKKLLKPDGIIFMTNWALNSELNNEKYKNSVIEKSKNELTELSKKIGIGAIKYGYLSKNRTLDTIFDWDEFMTFEGNSGPYIQYAYVRARQILEKSGTTPSSLSFAFPPQLRGIKGESFDHDEEIDLAKELFNYKSILSETATTYYPHILCNYAYNLTKKFNSFYNKVHILSEENETKKQLKLLLVDQFSQVLKDSFEILGIEMPEKM